MKTGYEQTSVNEIRQELTNRGITDEEFLKNTKKVLVDKLLEIKCKKSAEEKAKNKEIKEEKEEENDTDSEIDLNMEIPDSIFDEPENKENEMTVDEEQKEIDNAFQEAEEEEDTVYQKEENNSGDNNETVNEQTTLAFTPAFDSPAWNEYVMRQFEEDELMNGAPTCDGCRRVVEQLIGPIVSQRISSWTGPSSANNGTATVCIQLEILVQNENHPLCNSTIICEEIADVNAENTDHPYNKYRSATAASRAEGRALRKVLRLKNVVVAEEVSEKAEENDEGMNWEIDEPITDSQVNVIDMLCSRLDVDVMGFVNSGRSHYDTIMDVKKSTAQKMIQELNKVQRKVKDKPPVGGYKQGWKENKAEDS